LKQIWEFIFQKPKTDNKNLSDDRISSKEQDDEILGISSQTNAINLTKSMNWSEIISRDKFTVVRFTAAWCKPCKELEPLYNELSIAFSSKATFLNIDVDDFDELSAEYSAFSIPLFLCFQKGIVLNRFSGNDKNKLTTFINECLNA